MKHVWLVAMHVNPMKLDQKYNMKNKFTPFLIVVCALYVWSGAVSNAAAQSEVSAISAVSALPVASVVVGASAVAGAVVALPVVLSTAGAVLVIKTVESTARGTAYVLERASDGARASIEIVGRAVSGASMIVGVSVLVTVVGSGVVLSAAGEALAYIPNALGRALLHNERVTN
jgi:hypothetical protein